HGPGDAEVDHLGADRGEQHVGGLEVAVDDAGAVDRGERRGDPHGQAVQGAAGHRPVGLDGLGQVGAGDVLGDDEERLALQAGVEHAGGGEPGDAAGGGDLPGETAPEVLVVGEVGVDQFHRDLLARGVL